MRIIGYVDHPEMKITVFKMDNKVSLKFETPLSEQTYKFRDGEGVNDLDDVQRLVTPDFLSAVEQCFQQMHGGRISALSSVFSGGEDEFEEII